MPRHPIIETYRNLWTVNVSNAGDVFSVSVWKDTAKGAEATVRIMYPHAELIVADTDAGPVGI